MLVELDPPRRTSVEYTATGTGLAGQPGLHEVAQAGGGRCSVTAPAGSPDWPLQLPNGWSVRAAALALDDIHAEEIVLLAGVT